VKRHILSVLAITLLLAATGAAQSNTKTVKAVVSGKVSADGKTLVGDHNTWSVNNPSSLAGLEGHLVKVKCRLYAATSEIFVRAVKLADTRIQYAANKDDSAFRR